MPRRRGSKKKSARKRSAPPKRKRKIKRKHKTDVHSHAKRRHVRTKRHGHKKRMFKEAETMNYLLNQILKTASSTDDKPYNYHPRHHSKDPEYKWSNEATRQFKRDVPAPDFSLLRAQGDREPPHRGNYPHWNEHHVHEAAEEDPFPFY